jgi:hypothetical protein
MAQTIDNIVDPNDSSLTSEMVQFPAPPGLSAPTFRGQRMAETWARFS